MYTVVIESGCPNDGGRNKTNIYMQLLIFGFFFKNTFYSYNR